MEPTNYRAPIIRDEEDEHFPDPINMKNNNNDRSSTPAADAPAPAPAPAARGAAGGPQMELTFEDQHGTALKFKLKPTTSMKKAMDAFSARTQRERRTLRFHYDGQRVLDHHTPADLDMADGDQVDVHMEQIGGGGVGA